jgi:hypothetical protein
LFPLLATESAAALALLRRMARLISSRLDICFPASTCVRSTRTSPAKAAVLSGGAEA